MWIEYCAHLQGPFAAGLLSQWMRDGHFDGRGDLKFRRDDELQWRQLAHAAEQIVFGDFGDIKRRLTKRKEEEEDKEEYLPVQLESELEAPLRLDRLDTETTRKLFRHQETCDVDIWIYPEPESKRMGKIVFPRKVIKMPAHSSILRIASPVLNRKLDIMRKRKKADSGAGRLEQYLIPAGTTCLSRATQVGVSGHFAIRENVTSRVSCRECCSRSIRALGCLSGMSDGRLALTLSSEVGWAHSY
eukprot:GHVU01040122.1.p1 GENE.GHVU01040122.1~~GHVU01040122.1.p1  ORF type:complete len:245 (+),score=11.65 GHVU01040122.1:325-1059(+)